MRTAQYRDGFTLIELLVVISIIAILAALTAAGIFQVVESQRQTNSENGMRILQKLLDKQWQAVIKKANEESIPPKVLLMAGGDPARARVIWKCLRLKQEFPMTFAEAMEPYKNYAGSYIYLDPPANTIKLLDKSDLPPRYTLPPAPANNATYPFLESATCLAQALQLNRGGGSTSTDELGPYARDVNGDTLKELVDGWNNPIAFFRWGTALDELDGTNPATGTARGAKFRNPIDPNGTLLTSGWNNYTSRFGPAVGGVFYFEQLAFTIHTGTTAPTYMPWSRYTVPVIASSGRNGKFGLNATMNAANMNTDMSADTSPQSDRDDNIYSFRLKVDQRGD